MDRDNRSSKMHEKDGGDTNLRAHERALVEDEA